jgi:mannosylglycerate hydrolase
VEITTEFDNTARDHWLRLMIPTEIRTDVSSADSHFDVVERPITLPDCDDWKEPVVGTCPFRTFVDVSDGRRGLTVLTEGLHEFEVLDDEARTIAVSLVRSVRIKLEVSEQRKQELPDRGSQCPGRHSFRWALYPHQGNWERGRCVRESLDFIHGVRGLQFGKNRKGRRPKRHSVVELESERLVLSAVKKCETRDTLVVRIYNPTSRTSAGVLRIGRPVRGAWRVNMNEERIAPVRTASENRVRVQLDGKKIQTFEIEIGPTTGRA